MEYSDDDIGWMRQAWNLRESMAVALVLDPEGTVIGRGSSKSPEESILRDFPIPTDKIITDAVKEAVHKIKDTKGCTLYVNHSLPSQCLDLISDFRNVIPVEKGSNLDPLMSGYFVKIPIDELFEPPLVNKPSIGPGTLLEYDNNRVAGQPYVRGLSRAAALVVNKEGAKIGQSVRPSAQEVGKLGGPEYDETHVEIIAIGNMDVTGCTVYVTRRPCEECEFVFLSRGIKRVCYLDPFGVKKPLKSGLGHWFARKMAAHRLRAAKSADGQEARLAQIRK